MNFGVIFRRLNDKVLQKSLVCNNFLLRMNSKYNVSCYSFACSLTGLSEYFYS